MVCDHIAVTQYGLRSYRSPTALIAMRSRLAIGIAVLNFVAFQTSPIKVLATITLH